MYRVIKVLNNNGVIAIDVEENQEYVLLGNGIGFGKKVCQRFEVKTECSRYSLKDNSEQVSATSLAKSVEPIFWEIADEVLKEAERNFGSVDRRILFLLADHISFAVARVKNGEQISNPFTGDIHILFYKEFQVASVLKKILLDKMQIEIGDDEIGYVALHIHAAIEDEKVSVAMQIARMLHECVEIIERETGKKIAVMTMDFNRLMNHIKYMIARLLNKEELKLDINDYIETQFPRAFAIATILCDHLKENIGIQPGRSEIGYLAIHIERTYNECLA